MSQIKRRNGMGWLALLACAFLFLVSIATSPSYAQSTGAPAKNSDTFEGDDGTEAGDPDVPTGEVPPPSASGGAGHEGSSMTRGHAMTGGIVAVVPERRLGAWASWKLALKILARNFYYIR